MTTRLLALLHRGGGEGKFDRSTLSWVDIDREPAASRARAFFHVSYAAMSVMLAHDVRISPIIVDIELHGFTKGPWILQVDGD